MRVAMLVNTYVPAPEGGAERQCRRLARALIARGCDVRVFAGRATRDEPDRMTVEGAAIHRFGPPLPVLAVSSRARRWPPGGRGGHVWSFWRHLPAVYAARRGFIRELLAWCRASPDAFDVLHVHETGWLAGLGVAAGQILRRPVVCKAATRPALPRIGYDTPRRRRWDAFRRQADAWIAPTETARDELAAAGLAFERIHVIPNGIEIPESPADPWNSSSVLYVGNLTQGAAWKGFDVLFDAWGLVAGARPGARLTVVGAGDPALWRHRLNAAGAEQTAHFTGYLPDPSDAFRAAGIFILPSRVEGMSNALLEAQSFGLACVASDIPGNRAVVSDGVNGRLVPPDDPAALAAVLIELLDDADQRTRLGAAARRIAAERFRMECVAEKVLALYHQLQALRREE